MDFVSDQTTNGDRFRALAVVGTFTRECLAIEPGRRLGRDDATRVLGRLPGFGARRYEPTAKTEVSSPDEA